MDTRASVTAQMQTTGNNWPLIDHGVHGVCFDVQLTPRTLSTPAPTIADLLYSLVSVDFDTSPRHHPKTNSRTNSKTNSKRCYLYPETMGKRHTIETVARLSVWRLCGVYEVLSVTTKVFFVSVARFERVQTRSNPLKPVLHQDPPQLMSGRTV